MLQFRCFFAILPPTMTTKVSFFHSKVFDKYESIANGSVLILCVPFHFLKKNRHNLKKIPLILDIYLDFLAELVKMLDLIT